MICKWCIYAGDQNVHGLYGFAKDGHEKCDGKCDCQHVVGRTARAGREPK